MEPSPRRWRLTRSHPLVLRRCDDDTLLYHTGSGQTHLLNPFASVGLEALSRRDCDEASLVSELSRTLRLPTDDALTQSVRVLIEDLERLGLIEAL